LATASGPRPTRVIDQILRLVLRPGGGLLGAARDRGERPRDRPLVPRLEDRFGLRRSSPWFSPHHRHINTGRTGRPRRSMPAASPICGRRGRRAALSTPGAGTVVPDPVFRTNSLPTPTCSGDTSTPYRLRSSMRASRSTNCFKRPYVARATPSNSVLLVRSRRPDSRRGHCHSTVVLQCCCGDVQRVGGQHRGQPHPALPA